MSHGATPAVAALFALAVLLTAGIASACPAHESHSAQAPAGDGSVPPKGEPTRG